MEPIRGEKALFDERVVVRFLDGSALKGYGDNFLPGESELLVQEVETAAIHKVDLEAVKAIYFVKEFMTDSQMSHQRAPQILYQAVPGRRLALDFADGETMDGVATLQAAPTRGFFLTPLNPNSNNIQIYVNPKALKRFRFTD